MANTIDPKTDAKTIADQAKQLGLGTVALTAELVAQAPTDILPLPVVESRRILPYRIDPATQAVLVAVADPNQLKQAAPAELQAQRKLGRTLKLELTDAATFEALVPAIRERFSKQRATNSQQPAAPRTQTTDPAVAAASLPAKPVTGSPHPAIPLIDLATVTIPRSVFLKIPHDVATKFRIIAFAAPSASQVKLATDRPTDAGVKRVVEVIRAKRGVSVALHEAAGSQIDDLIDAYAGSADPISLVAPSVTKQVPVAVAVGSTTDAVGTAKPPVSSPAAPVTPPVNGGPAKVTNRPNASPSTLPRSPQEPAMTPSPVAPAPKQGTATGAIPIPPVDQSATVGASSRPAVPLPPLPGQQSDPAPIDKDALATRSPKDQPRSASASQPVAPKDDNGSSAAPATPAAPASLSAPDAMPVDTSPVVTPIDTKQPGKIHLASPLPNLGSAAGGSSPTPLPTEAASQLAGSLPPSSAPLSQPPIGLPNQPVSVAAPAVLPPTTTVTPTQLPPMAAPTTTVTVPTLPATGFPTPVGTGRPAPLTQAPPIGLAPIDLQGTDDQNLDRTVGSTIRTSAELESVVKTGLVPKILAAVLQYAVNTGASDIHIEAEPGDLRVRFRIDGQLQDILKAPISLHAPLVSRLKILAKMKIDEQRVPQDGRFGATTAEREIDFRVSTLPAIHGEKVVLRILDKSNSLKSVEQLGIDGANGQRIAAALAKPFGIILVTGPTGSGKTTTLYAMLTSVNKPGVNIVTLEDPVEYELSGITQTQVKPKIGFSFAEGLRSILRQDPDVIMVGEIRDRETASLATHAALTGHLVLSTLHTNNAAGAIPRFLDMGVEPFLIASSMEAVIGQRLVRKLCEACRQPAQLAATVQQDIQTELARSTDAGMKAKASQPLQLFSPKGCDQCHDGYKGRIGIYEVMTVTPEIESLTAKKAPLTEIEALAIQQGMITMKQDGILKALAGLTSIDEILRVTTSD